MEIRNLIGSLVTSALFLGMPPAATAECADGWIYRQHTKIDWHAYGTAAFEGARGRCYRLYERQ